MDLSKNIENSQRRFNLTSFYKKTCVFLFKSMFVALLTADKSLARPGMKQATATEDFDFHILFIIVIGGILVLHIYKDWHQKRYSNHQTKYIGSG